MDRGNLPQHYTASQPGRPRLDTVKKEPLGSLKCRKFLIYLSDRQFSLRINVVVPLHSCLRGPQFESQH